jgi:hypothetical protein
MWESAPATGGAPADPGALNVLIGVGKADAVKLSDVELVETPRSGGRLDLVVDARDQSDNLQFTQCAQRYGSVSDLIYQLIDCQTSSGVVCEQQGQHGPFDSILRIRSG